MGLMSWIKGIMRNMFTDAAKRDFATDVIESNEMQNAILTWLNVYRGIPSWVSEDGVRTIKMAKTVSSETARLANLDIDVQFDGLRGQYMTDFWTNSVKPKLRNWTEYGIACGTMILKPNGEGVDLVTPDRFNIVDMDGNGNITGIIFQDRYVQGRYWYTKLEYHRFEKQLDGSRVYMISNRTYRSTGESSIGQMIPITDTKWSNLLPDVAINQRNGMGIRGNLFGVFVMPAANDIDFDSALGVSIFGDALNELRDLDVAYTRAQAEIFDSETIELLDDRLLSMAGSKASVRSNIKLPHHVHNVYGSNANEFYQAIDRQLKTSDRKVGIDQLLSFIGYKCGYSDGYFVLDQKTGMVTATQVESDDRRTIQLIKDVRDNLQVCLNQLFYAQSVFADLYGYAPVGDYVPTFSFGDITYSYQEDKAMWWTYVQSGKVPAWMYFMKFEKMTEDEAKQMQADLDQAEFEKQQKQVGLFGSEE